MILSTLNLFSRKFSFPCLAYFLSNDGADIKATSWLTVDRLRIRIRETSRLPYSLVVANRRISLHILPVCLSLFTAAEKRQRNISSS